MPLLQDILNLFRRQQTDGSMRDLIIEINAWQRETFPETSALAALIHLREELKTEIDGSEDPEEAADLFFLLVQYCLKRRIDLEAEVRRKLEINKARQWHPPDERGVYYHVK